MVISCIFRKIDDEIDEDDEDNVKNVLPAYDEDLVDDPIMTMGW